MSFTLQSPFIYFNNPNNSNPVGLGNLYVGLPEEDPTIEANQVQVYVVDVDGNDVAVAQPIQLSAGGVPTYGGVPVQVKIDAQNVSIKVTNSIGAQVFYTKNYAPASGGGGGGGGLIYDIPPELLTVNNTYFDPESFNLTFSYQDVDSTQYVSFPLVGTAVYTEGGGGGGSVDIANAGGTGTTLLKTISADNYEVKRLKAGSNVTLTDDGNGVTINASGGGGGTTTLSNAGATGLPLVSDIVGADYPIRRIQAGTNVTITDNGTYYTINSSGGGGGGHINSLQNVNDAVGVGVYKETVANVGYFRRLQSSDSSIALISDVDDIDFSVNALPYTKINNVTTSRLLGRSTAGVGVAEMITIGANLTLSAGTLSATAPAVTDGDKGDIVVTGSGSTWSFDTNVVSSFARTVLVNTSASSMRSTLDAQQADATLTALAALSTSANQMIYSTGTDAFAMTGLTALARNLIASSTTSNMLNQLGIIVTTNANGTSIRIPTASPTSGIQICFNTNMTLPATNIALGSGFTSNALTWTFPQAFSSTPTYSFSNQNDDNVFISGAGCSATVAAARGKAFTTTAATTVVAMAIGVY